MKRRSGLLGVSLTASLTLMAGGAFASTFEYNGYSVVNNTNVTITGGTNPGYYGSGQIDLQGSGANAGQTLAAWCIDAFDDLQGSSIYNIISPPFNNHGGNVGSPVIGATALGEIGALIHYGDTNINSSYVSPAVQLAIWTIEYSGAGMTFTSDSSQVNSLVTTLVSEATNNELTALPLSYLREVVGVTGDGHSFNQGLAFEVSPVPLPAALPLFGTVLAGLGAIGWYGKRRKAA